MKPTLTLFIAIALAPLATLHAADTPTFHQQARRDHHEYRADLKKLGVPARLELFEEGGHGVGNLIPTRVQHNYPAAQWSKLLIAWLETLPKP
jgi:hypothetical protein